MDVKGDVKDDVWMMELQFLPWATHSLKLSFINFKVVEECAPSIHFCTCCIYLSKKCWGSLKNNFHTCCFRKNKNKPIRVWGCYERAFCLVLFINSLTFFFDDSVCARHSATFSGLAAVNTVSRVCFCAEFSSKCRSAQTHVSTQCGKSFGERSVRFCDSTWQGHPPRYGPVSMVKIFKWKWSLD